MARCELERIKEMKEFLENSEEDLLMKRIDKMQSVFRNEEKLKKELLETIEEIGRAHV